MNTARLDNARSRLEDLKSQLKELRNDREIDARSNLTEIIEEMNDRTSGKNMSQTFLNGRLRIKYKEKEKWDTGQTRAKHYRVYYRAKKDDRRTKVFEYHRKRLNTILSRSSSLDKHRKGWNNWEQALAEAAAEQVEQRIDDTKRKIREDFNGTPD